jgi:metal-sulfur cluster biosynthetic enzyme
MTEHHPESSIPDSAASDEAAGSAGTEVTEDQVRLALRKVKDPEINLNILDLGLIYGIRVDGDVVNVDMTLTSPGCPSGPEIMKGAEEAIQAIPGVREAQVNLVWTPFWTPDRIDPRMRAYLGM